MAESTSVQIEIDLRDFDEIVPAAELLSDADTSTRATRPYDVPVEDALGEAFGDMTRTSAQFTLPVALDELPDDAYPTEIYFLAVDDPPTR
jgi:hypothetical protein